MTAGPETEDLDADAAPSKSERKRRHLARQSLLIALADLPDVILERGGVRPDLHDALREIRALTRGARQRHVRYTAKRLDEDELPALDALVNADVETRRRDTARLHRRERWRDRLIDSGDEVLGELAAAFPGLDRARVRQLARSARAERERDAAPAAARKLLRYLRALEEQESTD